MSKSTPSRPPIAKVNRTFHIVASRFNTQYVDGLIEHVTEELRALSPDSKILLHRVPGSFEIPVVARELRSKTKPMQSSRAESSFKAKPITHKT